MAGPQAQVEAVLNVIAPFVEHRIGHPVIYVNALTGEEVWDSQGYDAGPEYEP